MSSPGPSSGTTKALELFEDLWRQLAEVHKNGLQELDAKVSKLKKERCLDAQRLEVFYSRNQQLKEHNKSLQDTISLLEERLRATECERCAALKDNLKNDQEQNQRLINNLKFERNSLKDENRKLQAEVHNLTMSRSESDQTSNPDQDDYIIPDSPVMPSSLPVLNRLKKRKKDDRHVRYTEQPLAQCNNPLFSEFNKESLDVAKDPGKADVFVPNTCVLETSQMSNDENSDNEEVIAETCTLEPLIKKHVITKTASGQRTRSMSLSKNKSSASSTLIHSPGPTLEQSLSLLNRVKTSSEDGSIQKAKRKKEEVWKEEDKPRDQQQADEQKEDRRTEPELLNFTSTPTLTKPQDNKAHPAQSRSSDSSSSPVFKKPDVTLKEEGGSARRKRSPLQDASVSHEQHGAAERRLKVEATWSIDPALTLSMYDSQLKEEEAQTEMQGYAELADTDCTWISHSMLQRHRDKEGDREESISGLGEKTNDSLDMMFDTTAYGEYQSHNCTRAGPSQNCGDGNDEEEYEEEEEDEGEEGGANEHDSPENSPGRRKPGYPTFAHVAVVRKKDERRKLQGTTCKECEVYYANLPEEEKQKKLSSCSRHRFRYIPPSTPENFWEVGFPTTQTCIDRGYIKEEKNPKGRLRRRQPLNALFSPKADTLEWLK